MHADLDDIPSALSESESSAVGSDVVSSSPPTRSPSSLGRSSPMHSVTRSPIANKLTPGKAVVNRPSPAVAKTPAASKAPAAGKPVVASKPLPTASLGGLSTTDRTPPPEVHISPSRFVTASFKDQEQNRPSSRESLAPIAASAPACPTKPRESDATPPKVQRGAVDYLASSNLGRLVFLDPRLNVVSPDQPTAPAAPVCCRQPVTIKRRPFQCYPADWSDDNWQLLNIWYRGTE